MTYFEETFFGCFIDICRNYNCHTDYDFQSGYNRKRTGIGRAVYIFFVKMIAVSIMIPLGTVGSTLSTILRLYAPMVYALLKEILSFHFVLYMCQLSYLSFSKVLLGTTRHLYLLTKQHPIIYTLF